MLKDTICAISTSLQEGAIGIVRVSGDEAIDIVSQIFSKDLHQVNSHTITYGNIIDQKEIIDEVLVSVFRAPKTYTREDLVEINGHGSVYLIRRILSLCIAHGARQARPGEFTERAFLNGRIDLTQAEAVNDLIKSVNNKQSKLALKGVKGSISRLLNPLVDDLLQLIANLEVNIDYPEYDDVRQLTDELVLPKLQDWHQRLTKIVQQAENGRIINKGIKTVIIGEPNVGKSSLLNALLEEDKAIVTALPGTTRDLVEGVIQLENVTLHLIDTAGLRATSDLIEQLGIDRTFKVLDEAELVIIVLDASRGISAYEKELIRMTDTKKQIVVYNKNDLVQSSAQLSISALNHDIKPLLDEIERIFAAEIMVIDQDILNNDRQIGLAKQALSALDQALAALNDGMELDIVLIDIEQAYQLLKSILGEVKQEDLLDTLFSSFCLGK
ncbi:MAG: tRNA uridine-5-carboxymethylaminomethyl(34) synthesis GTPase MnmE [Erysipelotrichaceae bacterium]|nr:tRNA uridine-5-carboxymethylaminomethyl(34) synthesis GTPase MnmE [Erysipelotrichaceae bacterium]